MFAIQLATGFTFNEVKEIFKKIPGTVEFSHTDGPALAGHFDKFEVVEI